ncbi:extracellular solute-binding protein [haloarchaeon 3A1-DGR]|nr:extracellular solute-binding protein [haloarchaeon 3A1-DGR]
MTDTDRHRGSEGHATRRRFLRNSAVGVTVGATVSGCLGGGGNGNGSGNGDGNGNGGGNGNGDGNGEATGSGDPELADEITFYSTGGAWLRAMDETIITPFEEEYGVSVDLQPYGNANQVISQIRAGQVDLDAMLMVDPALYRGVNEDIFAPLRLENIPHYDAIETFHPEEVPYDPGDRVHHVPNTYGAYGLTYNTETFDSAPTSWSELYTEELSGQLTYSGFTAPVVGNAALEEGIDFNTLEGGGDAVDTVFDRVSQQNEYMYQWWDSAATAEELYTNESAVAGNCWVGRVQSLRDEEGVPVEYTLPEEGATGYVSVWAINDEIEDPRRYTAELLLDYVLQEEPSRRLAEEIHYGQANAFSDAPESYQEIPDVQYPDRIHIWDQDVFAPNQQEWAQRFQEITRQ